MLKSLSGMDPTGLALITAGNMPQGVSSRSLAHTPNVPWMEEQRDPFAGLPCQVVPVSGGIRGGLGHFFFGVYLC